MKQLETPVVNKEVEIRKLKWKSVGVVISTFLAFIVVSMALSYGLRFLAWFSATYGIEASIGIAIAIMMLGSAVLIGLMYYDTNMRKH